jgi:hypothetical protein
MNASERLFRTVRDGLDRGLTDRQIIDEIKADESLIEASGSYCNQCGWCCGSCCANLAMDDGLAYCGLHDVSPYPNGKNIPGYGEARSQELDSHEWAKPLTCHTFGPHIGLLYNIRKGRFSYCSGSEKMARDYRKFLGEL